MQRISTTVVALIGERAGEVADALAHDLNVATVHADPDADRPLDRSVSAWRRIVRIRRTYTIHDADPLAAVEEAWRALYDGLAPRGDLEVEVAEAVARWRRRDLELPDVYLVLDAETLPVTTRHFYLGFLHGVAPSRVHAVAAHPDAVRRRLRTLRPGRWWPDLDRLLDGVDRVVPDRPEPTAEGEALVTP